VEAYERLVREGGAQGSSLATFLIKHYSWLREASYSLRLVSLGCATFRLALAKPPSMSRGRDGEELGPPGRATQMLALAKPPSMSRGVMV
jgi:hypothetical protein